MTAKHAGVQFWDTSALVSLLFQERHTPLALKARDSGKRCIAWDWLQVEVQAAIHRRRGAQEMLRSMKLMLDQFQFFSVFPDDHQAIGRLLEKHRLRAADAGHLFCLKQAKKMNPEIQFICFDDELNKAAEAEGIEIFG